MTTPLIEDNQPPRVRMAPSPTGNLHIGTARTALFNYLFAKHYGGTFVMRSEDTDLERSTKEFEHNILEGLEWLGIVWDEGVTVEGERGEHGPYRQSQRADTYRTYLEQLLKEGKAFYCWHTSDELQAEQQDQVANKEAPRHVCSYRDSQPDEAVKQQAIVRFRNDAKDSVTFHDYVKGDITFKAELLGDFSIAKRLDEALYNFAVVVDDETMRITHVVRGEDHISNTPKQILLQEALGFVRPKYVHLPLILGSDRSKLSKRHGATAIAQYRELGYLPRALFNFIALIGWHPADTQEIMPKELIVEHFSIEAIQQAGAIFDVEKLNWMNGEYIRATGIAELTREARPYLVAAGFVDEQTDEAWLQKVVALEQQRIHKLSEIVEATAFIFSQPQYEPALLIWKKSDEGKTRSALSQLLGIIQGIDASSWNAGGIEAVIMPTAEATGDRGSMLWPLRVALTGRKGSPGPFEIMEVLGKEQTLERLARAQELLLQFS
ncbi:MAG: glutamate--tRNA ligase [Candidatus Spechtbacterales bacterium]